jgi:hypothetical protein
MASISTMPTSPGTAAPPGAGNPLSAVHEVVLRRLLLDEAQRLGVQGGSDDDRIEALFAQEVRVPQADDAACRTLRSARKRSVAARWSRRATSCSR